MDARIANSTKNTYAPYVKQFRDWNASHGHSEEQIRSDVHGHFLRLFLASQVERRLALSTIRVALSAIVNAYQIPSWTHNSTHKAFMKGAARLLAAPPRQKRPFRSRWLRRLVRRARAAGKLDDPVVVMRITLLCVGFFAALRRSEIVDLDIGDISFHSTHVGSQSVEIASVLIRRSKTDQTHAGQTIVLPASGRDSCPVFWLRHLIRMRSATRSSPLFTTSSGARLSPSHVAFIVKDAIAFVAPHHSSAEYSGHSLRRGGISALSAAGAPEFLLQRFARHKDPRSTAKYVAPSLSVLVPLFQRA